jgi:hypothetical protein
LDNTADLVNEEAVVDLLETASDYERGHARLNSQQKSLVDKLTGLGGGIKRVGNQRKRNGAHTFFKTKQLMGTGPKERKQEPQVEQHRRPRDAATLRHPLIQIHAKPPEKGGGLDY